MEFVINFNLDPALKLDKKLLHQKNGKLLIDVDGELEINIKGACFFREPSFTLLELGVSLKSWRKSQSSETESFYFFTMEYDEREGPMLAFERKSENQWQLFSIWQNFEHEETLTQEALIKGVDRYLDELEAVLMERYRIRYADFIR